MLKERIQYSFDVWLFIPDEDKLIVDNEDVIIDNRLSKLLDFFCQHPRIVFSRDELINEVWNGSILTDQVITQAIFELRKILKSAERHSMGYIITVPKRGYKLDVEVQKNILLPTNVTKNTPSAVDVERTLNSLKPSSSTNFDTPDTSPVLGGNGNKHQPQQNQIVGVGNEHENDQQGLTAKADEYEKGLVTPPSKQPASQVTNKPAIQPIDSTSQQSTKQSSDNKTINDEPEHIATNRPQRKSSRTVIGTCGLVLVIGLIWWILQGTKSTSDTMDLNLSNNEVNHSTQPLSHLNDSTEQSRLNQTTDSQNLEAHRAHESVHYLSLEPRYIYVNIDISLREDAFKRGIIHKLMNYLTTYRDFRVVVDETLVANSANVIYFKRETDGDREYLDITYFNRISNFRHLGRDYLIDPSSLHSTMRSMLDDLLDSFNMDIQKSILKQQISELPKQEESLKLSLESLGLAFMTLDRTETLSKITRANELEPDNHFVLSNRYMYELADIFILRSKHKDKQIEELNKRFKAQLLSAKNNPKSYRVYDALAAYFLTQDNPDQAIQYLRLIPRTEYSVMSMIILAKIEEAQGNPAMAEEYYYEAILESGHPVILDIAQTLFFKSNITEIESKLSINH
ncbi:winged helix-turn-helix domain-containing protein [Vibrio cyclitrophicus]